jgi:RNA polymerase sigma factor (sigma-70 family)
MSIERLLQDYFKREKIYANILYTISELVEKQNLLRINQKAQELTDMPRGSEISNPTHKTVMKILGFQERIDDLEDRLNQLREYFSELEIHLQSLTRRQIAITTLRYLHYMTQEEIAEELKINQSNISRDIKKVLEYLEENIDLEEVYGYCTMD